MWAIIVERINFACPTLNLIFLNLLKL